MKKKYICLLLFLPFLNSFAGTISFVGPCEEKPLLVHDFSNVEENTSVGKLTVQILEKMKIPHHGTPAGINSIFNTPMGLDSMEVVSDYEMFAYGWCYSVNDYTPEVFPDKVVAKEDDQIKWWFGYAHYIKGEWVSQCRPSYQRKPKQFCN